MTVRSAEPPRGGTGVSRDRLVFGAIAVATTAVLAVAGKSATFSSDELFSMGTTQLDSVGAVVELCATLTERNPPLY